MNILGSISGSGDVKELGRAKLPLLCDEIRRFLVENVSVTGGHLSSNLGAVELTVALHRVYDSERDRIVFDVGHQSYVHKILTGRRDDFGSLRALGGLSSFPKPCESGSDAFIAGHASNSISVALGMARARSLMGEAYDVVAVIGDGALTGGLAYEGLSDAGESGEPLVLILNDNGMSIDPNVGGIVKLLGRLRMKSRYLAFKRLYRKTVGRIKPVYRVLHRIKEHIKSLVFPAVSMFEDMGLYYIGPVDGHNVERVETALRWARDLRIPVLLHVVTQKGKGYAPAEADPETYHGVGAFDPAVGVERREKNDFSRTFGETMLELAAEDPAVVAITAAMASGTGLTAFAARYPRRFFDVGIAEEHAAAMAAGMAKQGAKPVFAVYSTFLQRSYDMLIHDIALQQLHVVLAVDRAGLVGQDGETHHGTFDIAYLGSVPGMTILCPSSFAELRAMLRRAVLELDGPVAVRYPRGGEGDYRDDAGPAPTVTLRPGTDVTLVGYGILINEVLAAAGLLAEAGISAEVIKLNCVKPLDLEPVLASLARTGRLVAAEDVCAAGCVGQSVLAAAAARGMALPASRLLNMGSGIVTHGGVQALYALKGVDARGIAAAATELVRGGVGA